MHRIKRFLKNPLVTLGTVSFLILFLSFQGNLFGVGASQEWFDSFEKVSSLIAEKQARCRDSDYKGPLTVDDRSIYMEKMASGDCTSSDFTSYDSQYGLQTRLIAFFAPSDKSDIEGYFHKISMLLSAISALVFTILIVYVRKIFNIRVSVFVLFAIAMSPWVVAFARNLYWVEFAMFLPFVFSFVSYVWFRRRHALWIFFTILFVLFVVKLLNGYEHVSTVLVSAFAPILFHELMSKGKLNLRLLAIRAATVMGVGIVALLVAISINAAGLMGEYGSFRESLSRVSARADERGASGVQSMQQYVVGGFRATAPDAAAFVERFYGLGGMSDGSAHPIKYAVISTINYLTLPAISIPFVMREPIGSIVQSIGFLLAAAAFALHGLYKSKIDRRMFRALMWSYLTGLIGSLSWFILMPAHMYPHAHLNGIVFYMPTIIFAYIIIGLYIDMTIKKLARVSKRAKV